MSEFRDNNDKNKFKSIDFLLLWLFEKSDVKISIHDEIPYELETDKNTI